MSEPGVGPAPLRVGVDLIEVERIVALLARYGDRFSGRVFTERELALCGRRPDRLAARYAAKEAVAKALGTGIGAVSWREIEVLVDESGRPVLHLHGAAACIALELGLRHWDVSLSHTQAHAIAMVAALE